MDKIDSMFNLMTTVSDQLALIVEIETKWPDDEDTMTYQDIEKELKKVA